MSVPSPVRQTPPQVKRFHKTVCACRADPHVYSLDAPHADTASCVRVRLVIEEEK